MFLVKFKIKSQKLKYNILLFYSLKLTLYDLGERISSVWPKFSILK